MNFSSVAVEQREKEAEALKSFLAFSLIGSLALHIGVLTFGIGNLLTRVPESQEEPMEVTIIDPPNPPALSPKQEAELADSSDTGGDGGTPSAASAPSSIAIAPSQPKSVANLPRQFENLKTPVPQQKSRQTPLPEIATEPKPVITPSAPNSLPHQTVQQNRALVTAIRSRESQGITESTDKPSGVGNADDGLRQGSSIATSTGNGSGGGSGTGTGSGTGSGGTGTGSGTGSGSAVATGSGTARQGGDGNGDGSGRLGCRKCSKPKYPESARRQGVEGSAKIKVDVDDKGNVTNVRIAESTGNADLDEAAIRAARRWKFDTPNARQGVTAKVDFAIEGSERSRQVRERQRKREASRRQRATENATRTPAAPRTSRSAATGTTTGSTPTRPQEATPQRRQRVQTAAPRRSQQATPQQPRSAPPATSSQGSLLESLRRHQQESSPVLKPDNSAPSGANQ